MIEQDVLKRIEELLEFNHWSVYKLAKESGLSYSSLNNIFNRRTCPSIVTLEKICSGFGISLSEFFNSEVRTPTVDYVLTPSEQELINCHRSLSATDKKILEAYARGMCKR